ncbi:MAG: DUF1501 domain-containing protein [Planctomycetes bacterium]|nr:DUF1501 domain-containing protein [Planctomycetota bacterium]
MNSFLTRRQMLQISGCGFGYLALAGLATQDAQAQNGSAARNPLAPKEPHFPARAKRIIMLYMAGGPTHVDTFDYKPHLFNNPGNLLRPPYEFRPYGTSRLMMSELFPNVGAHADDICLVNSLYTDVPNHPQSCLMLHTGEFRFTRPSMGSWLLYGLGTENQNLPGFVTISPPTNLGGAQNYSNAFLPAAYQATRVGYEGTPVSQARIGNLYNPQTTSDQRRQLDLLQSLNRGLLERQQVNNELEGMIDSYELAFRMQNSVPGLMDISRENQRTLDLYGIGSGGGAGAGRAGGGGGTDNFGRQCLMARRFIEAGVRFVEVCQGGWDMHGGLRNRLAANCGAIDKPIGGLLTDLKQRGLLEDTLVIWGGEFGRTPAGQGADGRNHNSAGFSMWLAGGGVRGGQRVGATDETGARAAVNRVHHHDLHASVLHLMGLDHQRLTFRYGGRDYSLTDIHGRVVREIMA